MQQTFLRIDDAAVHPRHQALVLRGLGPVGGRVLQTYLRRIQEQVQFLGSVVPYLLVQVEQTAVGIAYPPPAALVECDVVYRVLIIEALVEVHQFVDVQLPYLPQAGAPRAAALGMVEGKCVGISHKRLPDAGEQQSQQRVDIGVSGYCRAGVGGRFLLVNDNGHRQVVNAAHVRTAVLGEVLLHE